MCKKMSQKLDRGFACVSFWPLTAWCGGFSGGFLFLENSGSKSAIFQVVSPGPGRLKLFLTYKREFAFD